MQLEHSRMSRNVFFEIVQGQRLCIGGHLLVVPEESELRIQHPTHSPSDASLQELKAQHWLHMTPPQFLEGECSVGEFHYSAEAQLRHRFKESRDASSRRSVAGGCRDNRR